VSYLTHGPPDQRPPQSHRPPSTPTATEAIPRPNRCLPEEHVHTSHLPNRSTRFLRRLSSRTWASTPAPTAPLQTGSSGEPLLPEITQSSSPCCRVAIAAIPDPPRRWPMSKSGQSPPPLPQSPTLPCFHVGRTSVGFAVGHTSLSIHGMQPALWQKAAAYYANGSRARFGPLALNYFPNFLI
jgi:hypothetical protein